jgi:hypothetical protein
MSATFEEELLRGVAQLLHDAGVGVTYRATGAYIAGETGIFFDTMPDSLPNAVQLSLYPVMDDPMYGSDLIGLQVISRSVGPDPFPNRQLTAKIFDILQGLINKTLTTGVKIITSSRRSGTSLGIDASKRWSRSNNYYLRVYRPTPNRL